MNVERLKQVTATLEALGMEVDDLRSLETEVAVNERPPGFLGKFGRKVKTTMRAQWDNLRGEVGETGEALGLLARRIKGKEPLEAEEADKVRAQLIDVVKVVPAGVLAVANMALPIPGAVLLTPLLLSKMGLMPSRWRDAHALEKLRKKAADLRSKGHESEAAELDALRTEVEAEADERDEVAANSDLLTEWDANDNGAWDNDEQAAYRKELDRLGELLASKGARKSWFLRLGPETWGPLRISELLEEAGKMDDDLLVCYDGRSGWIDLQDLTSGLSQV